MKSTKLLYKLARVDSKLRISSPKNAIDSRIGNLK